ncbi:MAG: NADP-dependent malic enzyme, partial [Bacteroidia bacterium]|nr:NADP-dependent malic enzyme [Bacteroidia bacterium]
CFKIEEELLNIGIPVMHDDQHGTAIISAAALLNALELVDKKIGNVNIVVAGAGAASVACTSLYISLGANKNNVVMLDSKGVIRSDRKDLNYMKRQFATDKNIRSLEDAMKNADVFIGLSRGNVLSQKMVKSMAKNPIVFAMANPDPEISYEDAIEARKDIIMATGRSDYPNQVNNVLGFPYIFRGALDVRAREINEEMKLAAVKALAQLAKEPVPESVNLAYHEKNISFGKEYIIPKPVDPRLITAVAPAVAKAAIDSGVAQFKIDDWNKYEIELRKRMGLDEKLIRVITNKAKQNPQRVVFAEADHYKILKAAQIVKDEKIAKPILLGNEKRIKRIIKQNGLDLGDSPIIDPRVYEQEDKRNQFGELFFAKRQRRGFTLFEAKKVMQERNYFGSMMVETGEADALISGITRKYPDTIRPALQVCGVEEGVSKVAGMYILLTKKGPLFISDTTVNVDPSAETLAEIAALTAKEVQNFNIKPRVAMLSYSNFGSSEGEASNKVRKAVEIIKDKYPGLIVDGEVQANFAIRSDLLKDFFPFSELAESGANTLIFPNLSSGNIAYKLLQEMGAAEAIGPILIGTRKSIHVLQLGCSVREIVNMITIAVIDAQAKKHN